MTDAVSSDSLAKSKLWFLHRFLGRRRDKPKALPLWRTCLWSFIGAFLGIASIEILFTYSIYFHDKHNVPVIVGSCGATAILIYGAIDAPLSQPRNVIVGTIIASFVGIGVSKLFLDINTPPEAVDHVRWVAGATAVATTLVLMQTVKSLHPPSGATALLPIVTPEVKALSWYYIPVMILSCTIMIVIALLVDNVERRYPLYWWSPSPPPETDDVLNLDIEKSQRRQSSPSIQSSETQYAVPVFGDIPPGVLDSEEEAVLRRIYEKLNL
ncbi:HPP family-domain-containing protein [Dichotomocladium elegans]|nr:HPP family-domain-containing protein [Dichotomocladium elegans]